jgi:hypothetical protein
MLLGFRPRMGPRVERSGTLRRATRTAYVREAGVYHLLRNGQAIDRIVLFGDDQLPK